MPSPFPGMDPYLEDPARWPGVHQRLITYLSDEIQPHIHPRYTAVIAEHPCGSERMYVATQGRNIHLVEIDLLGMGLRVTDEPRDELNRVPFHRYIISVNRATDREHVELYPIKISEQLPRFRIPLRPPDADVVADLQAAFNRCYDNGGFADILDYGEPPPVLLSLEEQAWANGVLHKEAKDAQR